MDQGCEGGQEWGEGVGYRDGPASKETVSRDAESLMSWVLDSLPKEVINLTPHTLNQLVLR